MVHRWGAGSLWLHFSHKSSELHVFSVQGVSFITGQRARDMSCYEDVKVN
jgi:hypothetical protein